MDYIITKGKDVLFKCNRPVNNDWKGGRIVKIKKFLSVLLISAVVMIPSASAFAEENSSAAEITPYVVGIGDSRENALTITPNEYGGAIYDLFIQSATDQDWFKWTNTTTNFKRIGVHVGGFSGNGPTRAGIIINYNNSLAELGPLYTGKAGTAETQSFSNILLPPGATIYVVVDNPSFTAMTQYHLNFAHYNISF